MLGSVSPRRGVAEVALRASFLTAEVVRGRALLFRSPPTWSKGRGLSETHSLRRSLLGRVLVATGKGGASPRVPHSYSVPLPFPVRLFAFFLAA